jgi:hypothetical protein
MLGRRDGASRARERGDRHADGVEQLHRATLYGDVENR